MLETPTRPRGEMQDKIREILLSYRKKEVPVTIDDLRGKTGLNPSQVYQTLYRLQNDGEITLVKDYTPDSPRPKITGVVLNKMEPLADISERNNERKEAKEAKKESNKLADQYPQVYAYLQQRVAVERAKLEVIKAKIDPSDIIKFEPNLLGEEALDLFKRLEDEILKNRQLTTDLEAARRDNVFLRQEQRVGNDGSGT